MACWTASAKWAEGPALDGQCAALLGLSLSEGLGIAARGGTQCMLLQDLPLGGTFLPDAADARESDAQARCNACRVGQAVARCSWVARMCERDVRRVASDHGRAEEPAAKSLKFFFSGHARKKNPVFMESLRSTEVQGERRRFSCSQAVLKQS